jgi:hypothetical protein
MQNDVLDKGYVSVEKLKDKEEGPVMFVYRLVFYFSKC